MMLTRAVQRTVRLRNALFATSSVTSSNFRSLAAAPFVRSSSNIKRSQYEEGSKLNIMESEKLLRTPMFSNQFRQQPCAECGGAKKQDHVCGQCGFNLWCSPECEVKAVKSKNHTLCPRLRRVHKDQVLFRSTTSEEFKKSTPSFANLKAGTIEHWDELFDKQPYYNDVERNYVRRFWSAMLTYPMTLAMGLRHLSKIKSDTVHICVLGAANETIVPPEYWHGVLNEYFPGKQILITMIGPAIPVRYHDKCLTPKDVSADVMSIGWLKGHFHQFFAPGEFDKETPDVRNHLMQGLHPKTDNWVPPHVYFLPNSGMGVDHTSSNWQPTLKTLMRLKTEPSEGRPLLLMSSFNDDDQADDLRAIDKLYKEHGKEPNWIVPPKRNPFQSKVHGIRVDYSEKGRGTELLRSNGNIAMLLLPTRESNNVA